MRRPLHVAKAALLLAIAAAFAFVSVETLSKLWAYRDSPAWVYVLYGTVAGLAAIVCLGLGVRSLRRY